MRFSETCLDLQLFSVIENIGFPHFLFTLGEWEYSLSLKVLHLD